MFRTASNLTALMLVSTLLTACGGQEPALRKPREAWRGKSEAACIRTGLVRESAFVKRARALKGPGPCGTRKPFVVSAALDGQVALDPPATLTCNMVPALNNWLAGDVQPSAEVYLGDRVTGVEVAASYGCRTRNSKRGAKIS
ncbi:MAG TPA: extensin family protein, partial [Afifellaceae bacterium]|nr:extensin family protein [Afifellaceae bacterium]